MITIHTVSCGFFSHITQSVKALSRLCVANRMANQPIYPEDFVLNMLLEYLEVVRTSHLCDSLNDWYKCSRGMICSSLQNGSYLICQVLRKEMASGQRYYDS